MTTSLRISVLTLAWSTCFAVSCSQPEASVVFEATLTVAFEGTGRPVVMGKTNLPNETRLLIIINRAESKFEGQGEATVTNGEFKSQQFSQFGQDLNPGTYTVEIRMPVPSVQPLAVQRIIGDAGQNLHGPLVKKHDSGVVVSYTTTFTVGTKSDKMLDAKARASQQKEIERWKLESCNGALGRVAYPSVAACLDDLNSGKAKLSDTK